MICTEARYRGPRRRRLPVMTALAAMSGLALSLGPAMAARATADTGWKLIAPMPVPRSDHGSALGADRRVYVIGGIDGSGAATATVEAYTADKNVWDTSVAPLPSGPREYVQAAEGDDGRIYAVGGADSFGNATDTVQAYTPAHRAPGLWTQVQPLNTARFAEGVATGPDGRIYAAGGLDSNFFALNSVEAYNPATNTWTPVAPLNTARAFFGLATGSDGRLYAIGGIDENYQDLASVEAYTPSATGPGSWAYVKSLPGVTAYNSAAMGLDGRVYSIGGDDPVTFNATNAVYAYSPATDSWSPAPPLNVARKEFAAATDWHGRIYVTGGLGANGSTLSSAEVNRDTR